MLFNELGNFKFVMLFMLIPISNLWMNGFIAGAVWIGILVYVVPPVLAYLLDRYEVGQPNHIHSTSHHYQQGNTRPQLNHEALLGGAMIVSQFNQHLHDNPIAGVELSEQSHSLSHRFTGTDFWESVDNSFTCDHYSHTTETTGDWNHFHFPDSDYSFFNHHDVFDRHGINPASGLYMMDSLVDVHGNAYGTKSADDFVNSHTWDSSFDNHSSFDSSNDFTHHDDFSSSCIESSYYTFGDNRH